MSIVETILEAKAGVITLPSTPAIFGAADRRRWKGLTDNTATCPFRSPSGRSPEKSQGGSSGNQWPLPWEEWN